MNHAKNLWVTSTHVHRPAGETEEKLCFRIIAFRVLTTDFKIIKLKCLQEHIKQFKLVREKNDSFETMHSEHLLLFLQAIWEHKVG